MTKVSTALAVVVVVVLGGVGVLGVPHAVPLVLWWGVIGAVLGYRVAAVVPVRALGLADTTPSVRAVVAAAFAVVASSVLAGLVVLIGSIGTAFLAAAAAVLIWRCERQGSVEPGTATGPRRQATPTTAPRPPRGISAMSTSQLCRAWRISYLTLQTTADAAALDAIASARRSYLEEMERRHPVGFRRWIESGAGAAGDPLPFMGADEPGSPGSRDGR